MVRFLSDQWVEAMADAVAEASVPPDASLVIDQTVRHGARDLRYHVVVADGRIAVRPGPAEGATVRFHQDLETAWAIASGQESAQRAFMAGRLRVGGDLDALVAHHSVLAAIDAVLAPLRAQTEAPLGIDAHAGGDA